MKSLRREIELYIDGLIQRELVQVINKNHPREKGYLSSVYYRVVTDLEDILEETARAIENGDNNG